MVEVPIIRLHGRALSESLMRPAGVAEALEFGQLDIESTHAQLAGAGLVELVAAGGVGARAGAHAAQLRAGHTASDSLTEKPASMATLM